MPSTKRSTSASLGLDDTWVDDHGESDGAPRPPYSSPTHAVFRSSNPTGGGAVTVVGDSEIARDCLNAPFRSTISWDLNACSGVFGFPVAQVLDGSSGEDCSCVGRDERNDKVSMRPL